MAMRLGEMLLRENLITKAQLEDALQAQVIFGGKLGTILIEMGFLSEQATADALRQLLGFPCARPDDLEEIPRSVIDLVSHELAEKYKAVPMAVSGRKLTLAMADPKDLQAIDEIAFRTGHIVLPVLALEVRLYFALERYYGIKRPMRYIAPPTFVREALDQVQGATGAGKGQPANEEDEYLGVPIAEQMQAAAPPPRAAAPAEVVEELEEIEEVADVTLEQTARRLVTAGNRDDVADALIDHLGAHFARAALFMVVGGQVTGWRAVKDRQPIVAIDQFQLPLSEPSVLRTAVESRSFFLGPVPQSGANLALTTILGKPAPTTAVLLPLSMLGRVVGVVYIDDPAADMAAAVAAVQAVVGKALLAFEMLILQNKILRT